MSPETVTGSDGCWALFLDVDGTLVDLATTPGSVYVSDELKHLLVRLSLKLDGALAIVTGRSLDDLDRLFAPLRLCASGVHGCEHRQASGCIVQPAAKSAALNDVRSELAIFVRQRPGLILEDKGYGLAVHYRLVPESSGEVLTRLQAVCKRLGSGYRLQSGKCVLEICPNERSKGTSIARFMQEPPFRGRTPIFIGDDSSDEDGFSTVNELGGVSIKVGDTSATLARHRLASVSEVLQWLGRMLLPGVASAAP